MPLHSGKIVLENTIREVQFISGNNSSVNTTNFTLLKPADSHTWGNYAGLIEKNPASGENVGVIHVTPDPYKYVFLYGSSNTTMISAILLKDALMPGEKVTISGYIFNGKDPFSSDDPMAVTADADRHIGVYYEDDWSEFSSFDTNPPENPVSNQEQTNQRRISGRGQVLAANGSNVGTVMGWMYSDGQTDTFFKQAPHTTLGAVGLLSLTHLNAAGSGLDRFFKITIRNDSSKRVRLKIYPQRGSGASGNYMGIYDLKAKFENCDLQRIEDPIFGHGIDFSRDHGVKFDRGVNRIAADGEDVEIDHPLDDDQELFARINSDSTNPGDALRKQNRLFAYGSNIAIFRFGYTTTADASHQLRIIGAGTDSTGGGRFAHTGNGNQYIKDGTGIFFRGTARVLKFYYYADLTHNFDADITAAELAAGVSGTGPRRSKASLYINCKVFTDPDDIGSQHNLGSSTSVPTGGQHLSRLQGFSSSGGRYSNRPLGTAYRWAMSHNALRDAVFDAGSTGAYMYFTVDARESDEYYRGSTFNGSNAHLNYHLNHGTEIFGTIVIQFGGLG